VTRRRLGVTIVAILAVLLVGAIAANGWVPTIPVAASSNLVARAVLTGEIAPDATGGADPDDLPRSPAGQECLDSIDRAAGPMSLCWEAWRDPRDGDPTQDYYRLRVYGTFGGETGTGVRWAVVRARLVGKPSNDVFDTWPQGTFEGPART
jgi:hypothetical protein